MIGREFPDWIEKKIKYSHKSALDASSRCRRVERIFDIILDKAVRSEAGLNATLARLETEKMSYMKAGINQYAAKATLTKAIRLYHQFLNGK